jgi:actin-related protein
MFKEAEMGESLENVKEILNKAVANKSVVRIKVGGRDINVIALAIDKDKYFVFKSEDDDQEREEALPAITEAEILQEGRMSLSEPKGKCPVCKTELGFMNWCPNCKIKM